MRYSGTADSFYELHDFPRCSQIVVSTNAFVPKRNRGKGYGAYDHMVRVAKAQELGYDLMICTVAGTNKAEQHILAKNRWKHVHSFVNRVTENVIQIWVKDLSEGR